MKRIFPFILLLLLGAGRISAQQTPPVFDDFSGKTELLSLRSIAREADGPAWLGSGNGLYSFDGYDLVPRPYPEGPLTIQCILVQEDHLLLGTDRGLFTFNPVDKTYERLEAFGDKDTHRILQDGHILYCGTSSGFYRFDPETLSTEHISRHNVFALVQVDDIIYLGVEGGLARYNPSNHRYEMLLEGTQIRVVPCILVDKDDLWLGTPAALLKYKPSTQEITTRITMPVVKTLCKNEYGQLLAGTDSGIFQINPETGDIREIHPAVAWDCFPDTGGDIWFATDNGMLALRQHPVILPVSGLPEIKNARYVTALRDGKDRLWLGGSHGIVLQTPDGAVRHFTMSSAKDKIPHNKVYHLVEHKETGTIYAATDGGCLQYDEKSGSFEAHNIKKAHNWFYDLIPGLDDLWAATYDGLYHLDSDKEVLAHYTRQDGLSVDVIDQIGKDAHGDIWMLGQDKHVFRLDIARNKLIPFNVPEMPLADCLTTDAEGDIWLASADKAVCIKPTQDSLSMEVMPLHSRTTLSVYSITEIMGQLWICTSEGFRVVDKKAMTVLHLDTYRNYLSIAYDRNRRRVLLGGLGGADIMDLTNLQRLMTARSSPPRLTDVQVNNDWHIPEETLRSGRLNLARNENHLVFSFSDFNFNDELPHRFTCHIDGPNSSWDAKVFGNKLHLAAVPPGKYVISLLSDTNYSLEKTELVSFRIRRPWYFSLPMMMVYLLLVSALIYGLIRYITMRRNLDVERIRQDELVEQTHQKEAFFQDVAHEFKTPLSLIIGPVGKLLGEARTESDVKDLQMIQDNAMKISTLIHHTIDHFNEAKGIVSSLITTDVEFVEFARSIFNSFKDSFPQHEFIFDSSQPRIPVSVDVVKMETVMNNLLSNACKYTPEGGSILLTLDRDLEGKQLVVKVSDTGVGIPEEDLPFVFQRYFESSRTKGKGYESTGIGLSVIKQYVELHGGQVSVDSDQQGTSFTLLLPVLSDRTQDETPVSSLQEDSDKPLVAIIDDNVQICQFIESLLEKDFRCISSHNGKSGLKLCKDVMPDLIISDVLMPVMDGLEMCRQLRAYGPLSTIPIILLTAKDDAETEQRSIDLNVDIFLPKPFEPQTLTARVNQLLTGKKRMEQKVRMEMISNPSTQRSVSPDERYLQKVMQLIEEHLDDSSLSVGRLCELGEFNEKQLYRKIKQFTGLSAVEYIRSIRLKKAALLLQTGNFTVSEVMYSVGFSNASYFTRAFAAMYKMTPSEYMKSFKEKQ